MQKQEAYHQTISQLNQQFKIDQKIVQKLKFAIMAQQNTSNNNQNQAFPEHIGSPSAYNNFADMTIEGRNQPSIFEYLAESNMTYSKMISGDETTPKQTKLQQKNQLNQNSEDPMNKDTLEFTNKPQKQIQQLQRCSNNQNVFDEKPIKKSDFNLSEFPQGSQVFVEINYTMTQKLKSKAAKMRLSGMQDLLELLENNPNSSEVGEIQIVGLLKQTTPANIEKIIQCLKLWVQKNKEWGEDEAKLAIQNGYINGKANSRKFTIETIDLMYQQKPALIQMVIVAGLKNKTPKIIAGYNGILNQLLAVYGIKRMNYLKPYLSEIVRVTSTEKLVAVKTEGVITLKEAYKWLGKEVVEPMLSNLKENLKKQIDSFWETYDKTIIMSAPKDIKQDTLGRGRGKKIDAYDLSQAVDVFKKFDQKWAQSVLNAQKWNQKTKLMQQFVKATTVPKFANTDFRHISEVIRRELNDSNFNVVLWDLKIIAAMSKGLRKYFMPVAKSLFSSIISKFREKKTLMVEQTFKTLNDLNYCLALEDVLESVKEGLNDKVPNMKCNLLDWIAKHVEKKTEEKGGECPQKTEDAIKQLLPIFQKLTGDGVAEVRESMAKNLAKMDLLLSQDFFSSIKTKFNKSAVLKNADIKGNQNALAPGSRNDSKGKQPKTPQKSRKNSSLLKNEESRAIQKSPNKKINEINIIKTGEFENLILCFQEPSYEQSLQILKGFGFPQKQIDNITALGTKERGKVLQFFRQNPYQNFNAVLRVLKRVFKEWKEVNVMMNKDLISYLEERQAEIGKQQLYVIIPFLVDKIGDSKFSQSLYCIITNICSRVSGRYIIGHIIKYSSEGKKPKLIGDACTLLVQIISNISLVNCPVRSLVEYAQSAYLNLMIECRKDAIQLLNCLYSHKGSSLKSMLDQITVRQMEAEFNNIIVLSEDEKKPKIILEGEAAIQHRDPERNMSKTQSRTCDLSNQVQQLIPKMNDTANWQNRKLAAQSLIKLIEQADKVVFGSITDLLATVKAHINDSNKQLIKIFVHLAGLILCASSEKQAKGLIRPFMTVLIQGFNDKNQQNRKQIHLTINKIAAHIGKDYILSFFGPFLEGDREGRLEVLTLILNNEEAIQKADVKGYPKGVVNCLCDKNKQIRSLAEKVFEKIYKQLGLQIFRLIANDQKTAVAKDLNLFLDRFGRSSSLSCRTPKRNSTSKTNQNLYSSSRSKSKLIVQQQPPMSNKKAFMQKSNPQKSFLICDDQDLHATASMSYLPRQSKTLVQGTQNFADVKILTRERVERQSLDQSYIWRFDEIKQFQEQTLRQCIQRLMRADIAKSLFCLEYKRVLEGFRQLMKLCKQIGNHAPIRQLYDLLFKTLLLRLWGGHPDLQDIIELLPPILAILEKKGIAMGDKDIELVVTILREYLISASMGACKVSENLPLILTNLIALSSGERVLKNILRQFCLNLTKIHGHLKSQSCLFYRQGMKKLIKTKLMDCMGYSDILQQVSKIKELREDHQFVEMLYKKIHKTVLDNFGFKRAQQREQSINVIKHISVAEITNHRSTTSSQHQNQNRDKSSEGLPPRERMTSKTVTGLNKLVLSSSPGRKLNFPQQMNTPSISSFQLPVPSPSNSVQSHFNQTISQYSSIEPIVPCNSSSIKDFTSFNLTVPAPIPPGPFGKHLAQLFPPSDVAINFFNSVFVEAGDKMSKELSENAKSILNSILKSVEKCFQHRNEIVPDRIIAQILLLQNCIKCSHVIKNVGDMLEEATLFALNQLVYEDQNKTVIFEELQFRNIQFKTDGFIKAINGVMLRLLETANSQDNLNVFLKILTVQYANYTLPSPKLISLLVKCIVRVSANYTQHLRQEQAEQFITQAISYLSVISFDTALQKLQIKKEGSGQRLKPDFVVANSIKSIVDQLCKAVGSEIWQYYEAAKGQFQYPDKYIASYITFLNIRPPQKKTRSRSKHKQDEELKKICQLLSKTKSYDTGIMQLKRYCNQHAEFRPLEYFTSLNYDSKFILMVIHSIDVSQPKQASWKEENVIEQANCNIKDKLKKLKDKFQQSQVKEQRSQDSLLAKDKQLARDAQRDERAEEIRRRIEEMKSKMSSAVSRSKP